MILLEAMTSRAEGDSEYEVFGLPAILCNLTSYSL